MMGQEESAAVEVRHRAKITNPSSGAVSSSVTGNIGKQALSTITSR
jgi:hypothetical protein